MIRLHYIRQGMFIFLFAAAQILAAYAAEEHIGLDYKKEGSETATQGDVAVIIVRAMALESELPKKDRIENYLTLLNSKGVRPLEGWDKERAVTNGDLAVILVRALNLEGEVPPAKLIVEKNRDYIQKVWEMQYRIDLHKEPIEKLFTDKRFFPEGQPLCPYNFKYTDEDMDNLVDHIEIKPGTMEKDLTVKYIYTLKEKGMAFEGSPGKILRFQEVMDILRSPLFRSAPEETVFLHEYNKGEAREEGEEASSPLSPGGS